MDSFAAAVILGMWIYMGLNQVDLNVTVNTCVDSVEVGGLTDE